MNNNYTDRLKKNLAKELRDVVRGGIYSGTNKVDKSILAQDFFDFWLKKMELPKEEFLSLCKEGPDNELIEFIFGTYAEANKARLWACNEFLDIIANDKSYIVRSLWFCLKNHTQFVSNLERATDDTMFNKDLKEMVEINQEVFLKLITKIKELNIKIQADDLLTSNTTYKKILEGMGLSEKQKINLDKLNDLVQKDINKINVTGPRDQNQTKDYLVSICDSFTEVFPKVSDLTKWLENSENAENLNKKGITALRLIGFILADQSKLTEDDRTKIINSLIQEKELVKDMIDNYSTLEVLASNNPKAIPQLIDKVMEFGKDKIIKTIEEGRGRYNIPSFTSVSYSNNALENLYVFGVTKNQDKESVLKNWLSIKKNVDEIYGKDEDSKRYKGMMYLCALEMLIGDPPPNGYTLEEQKLISKHLKDAIKDGAFNHFEGLEPKDVAPILKRVVNLGNYIDISPVVEYYKENIHSLVGKLFRLEKVGSTYNQNSIYNQKIDSYDTVHSIKYLCDTVSSLNMYEGLKSIDWFRTTYSKHVSRNKNFENNYPLALEFMNSFSATEPIIKNILVGNEDKILEYKDEKGLGFMERALIKTKGRAKTIVVALAEHPETVKKIILDDKKLTRKLYNLKDEEITRVLDKCKIECELKSVKEAPVKKAKSLKI